MQIETYLTCWLIFTKVLLWRAYRCRLNGVRLLNTVNSGWEDDAIPRDAAVPVVGGVHLYFYELILIIKLSHRFLPSYHLN